MFHKDNRTLAAFILLLAAVPMLVLSCSSSPTGPYAAVDEAAQDTRSEINPKGRYIPVALNTGAPETAVVIARSDDSIMPADAAEGAMQNGTTSLDVKKVLVEGNRPQQ